MLQFPPKEDLEKLKAIHDRIKNHEFRHNPQQYLIKEYAKLFEDAVNIISRYTKDGEKYDWDKKCMVYFWRYHYSLQEKEEREDKYGKYHATIDVWSNPTIAIINEAMHDFRGIEMSLTSNWNGSFSEKHSLPDFIEYSETLLQLIHKVIDGQIITKTSFPNECWWKPRQNFEYVQNNRYDNNWTEVWAYQD